LIRDLRLRITNAWALSAEFCTPFDVRLQAADFYAFRAVWGF